MTFTMHNEKGTQIFMNQRAQPLTHNACITKKEIKELIESSEIGIFIFCPPMPN